MLDTYATGPLWDIREELWRRERFVRRAEWYQIRDVRCNWWDGPRCNSTSGDRGIVALSEGRGRRERDGWESRVGGF